jgi:hypothetical protein
MRNAAPTSRRRFLGALAAAPALAVPAIAGAAQGDDAELLALEAEINRIRAISDSINETRVLPFDEGWDRAYSEGKGRIGFDERFARARAYSHSTGREAAISEQTQVLELADRLFTRMLAIPATTQAGRAAKVRTLLLHVAESWRGTKDEIDDYPIECARSLLGEWAGMSEAELAAI